MVTVIKDSACVKGALQSVLIDSLCPSKEASDIFDKIIERTEGNNTNMTVDEIANTVSIIYDVGIIRLNNLEEFRALHSNTIDNSDVFGMLFWRGDGIGNNCHATRLISKNESEIELMEPGEGIIGKCTHEALFTPSPLGFDLLTLKIRR